MSAGFEPSIRSSNRTSVLIVAFGSRIPHEHQGWSIVASIPLEYSLKLLHEPKKRPVSKVHRGLPPRHFELTRFLRRGILSNLIP